MANHVLHLSPVNPGLLKKLTALFVLFAILLQFSGKLAIFLGYEANKQFIANTLCVNKTKPSMHCNGKCFLAMQLKKEQKKESSIPSCLKEKLEIITAGSFLEHSFSMTSVKFIYPPFVNEYSHFSVIDIFHPPLAA